MSLNLNGFFGNPAGRYTKSAAAWITGGAIGNLAVVGHLAWKFTQNAASTITLENANACATKMFVVAQQGQEYVVSALGFLNATCVQQGTDSPYFLCGSTPEQFNGTVIDCANVIGNGGSGGWEPWQIGAETAFVAIVSINLVRDVYAATLRDDARQTRSTRLLGLTADVHPFTAFVYCASKFANTGAMIAVELIEAGKYGASQLTIGNTTKWLTTLTLGIQQTQQYNQNVTGYFNNCPPYGNTSSVVCFEPDFPPNPNISYVPPNSTNSGNTIGAGLSPLEMVGLGASFLLMTGFAVRGAHEVIKGIVESCRGPGTYEFGEMEEDAYLLKNERYETL